MTVKFDDRFSPPGYGPDPGIVEVTQFYRLHKQMPLQRQVHAAVYEMLTAQRT